MAPGARNLYTFSLVPSIICHNSKNVVFHWQVRHSNCRRNSINCRKDFRMLEPHSLHRYESSGNAFLKLIDEKMPHCTHHKGKGFIISFLTNVSRIPKLQKYVMKKKLKSHS